MSLALTSFALLSCSVKQAPAPFPSVSKLKMNEVGDDNSFSHFEEACATCRLSPAIGQIWVNLVLNLPTLAESPTYRKPVPMKLDHAHRGVRCFLACLFCLKFTVNFNLEFGSRFYLEILGFIWFPGFMWLIL